jgi:hypothetical protein
MKNGFRTTSKNEGALKTRFLRHCGIYRYDVSSLLVNLGQSAAIRSGPGQAIGRAGRNTPCSIVRDEFRPAIPQRVARQHCPSPLHRHHQHKPIAASIEIIYHRAVTSLLTVCLSPGGRSNQPFLELSEFIMKREGQGKEVSSPAPRRTHCQQLLA